MRKFLIYALISSVAIIPFSRTYALTLENTSYYTGSAYDPWGWSIFLSGDPSEIDAIRCVTYHLRPTFPYPDQRICNPGVDPREAFILSIRGWGPFVVTADLFFRDGTTRQVHYQLVLGRPSLRNQLTSVLQEVEALRQKVENLERQLGAR